MSSGPVKFMEDVAVGTAGGRVDAAAEAASEKKFADAIATKSRNIKVSKLETSRETSQITMNLTPATPRQANLSM